MRRAAYRVRLKLDDRNARCELTKRREDSVRRNYGRILFPFYSVKSFLDVSVQTFLVTRVRTRVAVLVDLNSLGLRKQIFDSISFFQKN
jgi:hypothetical protein